jgi:protein SCO1/2
MLKKWFMAILAIVCLCACEGAKPTPFHAQALNNPQFGRDFKLTDHNGQTRTLADWRGKVALVFFGYTQCPDVCPSTLYRLAQVMALLGPQAEKTQVLFITLDPERDNPALLQAYTPSFHPSFLGLYTSVEKTPTLARDFQVFYRINPGQTPGGYSVDHSVATYAYDPSGRLRLSIPHDAAPEEIAEDIRRLLAEAGNTNAASPSQKTTPPQATPPHGAQH